MSSYFSYISHHHKVVLDQSIACLYHASMSSEERFYSFVLWVRLDMAKSKKSKENNIVGSGVTRRVKWKRICRWDSAGTYSAVEGPSPPAKSTNTVSPAPPATACASTVPASQRVTRSFAPELASSQAAFTPNTTSEALLTQHVLAGSDEPHGHQHQDDTWPSQVAVACSFICTHSLMYTNTFHIRCWTSTTAQAETDIMDNAWQINKI